MSSVLSALQLIGLLFVIISVITDKCCANRPYTDSAHEASST